MGVLKVFQHPDRNPRWEDVPVVVDRVGNPHSLDERCVFIRDKKPGSALGPIGPPVQALPSVIHRRWPFAHHEVVPHHVERILISHIGCPFNRPAQLIREGQVKERVAPPNRDFAMALCAEPVATPAFGRS